MHSYISVSFRNLENIDMNLSWIFKDKHYINFSPVVIIPTEQVTFYFLFFFNINLFEYNISGSFSRFTKTGCGERKTFLICVNHYLCFKSALQKKKIIKKKRNIISMFSIICNVKEIAGKRKIVHRENHLNYCIFLIILL